MMRSEARVRHSEGKAMQCKDSIKPFDACCLRLKPFVGPLCRQKGHVVCKECILECLLAQKKDVQRKPGAKDAAQQKQEKEVEEEKLIMWKAGELDAFDQQNHGAVPQYSYIRTITRASMVFVVQTECKRLPLMRRKHSEP